MNIILLIIVIFQKYLWNKNILFIIMFIKDTIKYLSILNEYKNIKIQKLYKNIFFKQLFNELNIIYKDIIKNFSNKNIIIKNILIDKNININEFITENIKNKINKTIKYGYLIHYENIILKYYRSKKINNNILPKLIIHILIITKSLLILFKQNFKNNIQRINYYELNHKKVFPKNNNILSPYEINSGLTYINVSEYGEITLFRKEEILKVLIHELIHSNLIDKNIIFSNLSTSYNNMFCVNYNILLNEAFTETIANILNIIFINIMHQDSNIDMLNDMFKNEVKYSIYIYSKIMDYYKINNIKDIIKNKDGKCIKIFPQKTNVFSYYFLKSILLLKHISFGNILNNLNSKFELKNDDIMNIIELINNNIELLNKYKYNIKDKNKSLRLTLYEYNL